MSRLGSGWHPLVAEEFRVVVGLEAREVVLLVGGAAKRGALRRLLDGAVTPDLPASALRRHPRCTVLADRAVAP